MTVHLLKLCVGIDSVEQLEASQRTRLAAAAAAGRSAELLHRTRHRPRRDDEVLDGGSLYWIIKGFVRCRQPIIRLDELTDAPEGKRCGIVMAPVLIRTSLQARRPHQGWRYLEPRDAPADLPRHVGLADEEEPPPEMAAALRELGLL